MSLVGGFGVVGVDAGEARLHLIDIVEVMG